MTGGIRPKSARYPRMQANYTDHGVMRYRGNAFIEALPLIGVDDSQIDRLIERCPNVPTGATRKQSEYIRRAESNALKDVVYPRTQYKDVVKAFYPGFAEAYHARNPLDDTDLRRRLHIARSTDEVLVMPSNWKSSGSGLALIGPSGTGKTTIALLLVAPLMCVIEHTMYKGQPLQCIQIPAIYMVIPHDATLSALCLQFFEEIDLATGTTQYAREALGRTTIATMVSLMRSVATAVSLGGIVIDELQHLSVARSRQAEFVLNLFTQLIESVGLFVVTVCTPAIEPVVRFNARNLRKLSSGGAIHLDFMQLKSKELHSFQDFHWDHTYTSKKLRLTPETREAWEHAGAGNPAFMVMAFMLAQQREIGRRECVDALSFASTFKNDMYLLHPAINAIRSGNKLLMGQFDDLIFTHEFDALRSSVGWDAPPPKTTPPEFAEIGQSDKPEDEPAQARGKSKSKGQAVTGRLPKPANSIEDPRTLF